MRKGLLFASLTMLVLFSLLALPQTASAELAAGVQLGYGTSSYQKVLGADLDQIKEWSSGLWANYDYEDLLFTALYQGANGLKGDKVGRNLVQAAANYRFLQEELLQVYGGIGYKFLSTRFEHDKVEGGNRSTLTGHGFVGQVVVDIAISEQIHTTATITGNPWMKWAFNQEGITNANIDAGRSFTYQLDLFYEFSEDFGLQLGLLGGSYKVPKFDDKGETKGSYTGISLGVTRSF